MGQAGAGEDGQLLPAHQRIQSVNGGNTGLDELVRIVTGGGVHGKAVDVPVRLGQNGGAAVNGNAHAGEHSAHHVLTDSQLQRVPQKAHLGLGKVDACGGLVELHHGGVAVDLQHLAPADAAVGELNLRLLVIGHAADTAHHHQRAVDGFNCLIFPNHHSSSPLAAISAISCSISAPMAA